MASEADRKELFSQLCLKTTLTRGELRMMEGLVDSCKPYEPPRGYKGNQTSYNTLVTNNSRLGFTEEQTRQSFDTNSTLHRFDFGRAVKKLASVDLLASLICEQMEKAERKYFSMGQVGDQLAKMHVLEKMISRTLKQREYDRAMVLVMGNSYQSESRVA